MCIEIKGGKVHEGDLKGLKTLLEDGPVKRAVVVCLENQRRVVEKKIAIVPWKEFLEELWG